MCVLSYVELEQISANKSEGSGGIWRIIWRKNSRVISKIAAIPPDQTPFSLNLPALRNFFCVRSLASFRERWFTPRRQLRRFSFSPLL
jgi:hypothetical protein